MKYIKKDEFKNTKHCFRGEFGEQIIIEDDVMSDDYVYENNSFVFDILETITEEIIESIIDPVKDVVEDIVDIFVDKIVQENIIEPIENVTKDVKEICDVVLDPIALVLEELEECSTVEQIQKLSVENNIDLDGRIRNIKKLKDNFKEELEIKI